MVITKLAQCCQSFESLLQNQTWFELHTVQMHLIGLHTFEITNPRAQSRPLSPFEGLRTAHQSREAGFGLSSILWLRAITIALHSGHHRHHCNHHHSS